MPLIILFGLSHCLVLPAGVDAFNQNTAENSAKRPFTSMACVAWYFNLIGVSILLAVTVRF
ncbi:hypothetical protein O9929_22135 [Vibrio lentus]|nr:hypothetical protein [Vibrio lentus]